MSHLRPPATRCASSIPITSASPKPHDSRIGESDDAANVATSSANLQWKKLKFSHVPTAAYVKHTWTESGGWSRAMTVEREPTITIHILSNALHYGQVLFEGLKAHAGADGRIRSFASHENAIRLNAGAERLDMPSVPVPMFEAAIKSAVSHNRAFIPPYGCDGSMYIRPMLFGHGAQIGVAKAPEFAFAVVTVPVGPYFPNGLLPVDALVVDDFDRAAPRGVGAIKTAGNYAADLMPAARARHHGGVNRYPLALYLDARHNRFIEEFSTSNFVAISRSGTFVTPQSPSILPSITKKVLMILAKDAGIRVEERPVAIDELEQFSECAAVGTAVVVNPVTSITHGAKVYKFGEPHVLSKLYREVRAIQLGMAPDRHRWNRILF